MNEGMDRRQFLKLTAAASVSLLGARLSMIETLAAEPGRQPWSKAAAMRALGEHRIARFDVRRLQDRYLRSIGPNSKTQVVGWGGGFQVRTVTTDQGTSGWSMSGGDDAEAQRFVGTRIADLFDVTEGTSADVPWWLEKPLYDLAGNILGIPVYELIGATGPKEVALYSGAIYLEDVVPEDKPRGIPAVLEACKQDHDAGYRAFKLKIGRGRQWMERKGGLKRDIEVTRAVREQFPSCGVLVDANDAYTVEEAIEYVQGVADCNLYWIEEPFEENRDGLKRLREAMSRAGCNAMIADGEARHNQAKPPTPYGGYTTEFVDRLYATAALELVDVFVLDLGIVGFTRWRRIMPDLVKAGVKASPHTWMWTPRPYYAAQLAAGVGNVPIVEGIPGAAKGIDYSAYTMKDGRLVMPGTPGFGLKLEE